MLHYVCCQMSCYILTGYTPLFYRRGECCRFGFLKYTHNVCWWRLAISAGASHLHANFSLAPKTDKR